MNPLLKWIHLCFEASERGFQLYLDGLAVPNRMDASRISGLNSKLVLEGGGIVVIGQDQDTLGDGFSESDSFSGLVADLQMFDRILTQEDISAAAHCRKAIPNAVIAFRDTDWVFNNVTRSLVSRKSLCKSNQAQFFPVFHQTVNLETNRQLCSAIGGQMPHENSSREIFQSFEEYATNWRADFVKVHVRIITTSFTCDWQNNYAAFVFMWKPGRKSFYALQCLLNYAGIGYFMCNVRMGIFYRLYGLPENKQAQVDSHYLLHHHNGRHLLRGISKSYIQHNGDRWCLYAIKKEKPFHCYLSHSDYPPVGRRQWESTKLLLTICAANQFTCDSGHCIEINKRCDMQADCEDKSDESECSVVRSDVRQVNSMGSIPLTPLLIIGNIRINSIPEIDISRSVFTTLMRVSLTWQDERLYLYNVKEISVIKKTNFWAWHPDVQLVPAKVGETPKTTDFTVRRKCPGQPTVKSISEGEYDFFCLCVIKIIGKFVITNSMDPILVCLTTKVSDRLTKAVYWT